jgi:hypothetical protein
MFPTSCRYGIMRTSATSSHGTSCTWYAAAIRTWRTKTKAARISKMANVFAYSLFLWIPSYSKRIPNGQVGSRLRRNSGFWARQYCSHLIFVVVVIPSASWAYHRSLHDVCADYWRSGRWISTFRVPWRNISCHLKSYLLNQNHIFISIAILLDIPLSRFWRLLGRGQWWSE